MSYLRVWLKKGKEKIIEKNHQWIFSGAIFKVEENTNEGDIVKVLDHNHHFLCLAFYHQSNIALRIISKEEGKINQAFWIKKLKDAFSLRETIGLPSSITNAYRLFHGEGDAVSGLIIDVYNTAAVIQSHHKGIVNCIGDISNALLHLMNGKIKFIYHINETRADKVAAMDDSYIYGGPDGFINGEIVENGNAFAVDWESGQKTGFFLDQRENREILKKYCQNKKVLNCYSYSGGFSIYAAAGGAKEVTSVDISRPALDLLEKNITLNPTLYDTLFKTEHADVMDFLKSDLSEGFDVIIVDPPAFAKNISKRHNAIMAYKRLNALAISKINDRGLIFTFSCSQVVDTDLFTHTITAAAMEAGRNIRILGKLMQGSDHPINIFHQETSYLKGLILYVE